MLCLPAKRDMTLNRLILKKIAIFVDVQNIYYNTRDAYSRLFNYKKLWGSISAEGEIVSVNS